MNVQTKNIKHNSFVIVATTFLLLWLFSHSAIAGEQKNTATEKVDVVVSTLGGSAYFVAQDVATDAAGNTYEVDTSNHMIRKTDSAGSVTTLAGSGSAGSANGNGTAASFHFPYGVATDAAGNVYVADSENHMIRKIDSDGNVTTLAGSGSAGSANGDGTTASFNFPTNVATDAAGNVIVADTGNGLTRKLRMDDDEVEAPEINEANEIFNDFDEPIPGQSFSSENASDDSAGDDSFVPDSDFEEDIAADSGPELSVNSNSNPFTSGGGGGAGSPLLLVLLGMLMVRRFRA